MHTRKARSSSARPLLRRGKQKSALPGEPGTHGAWRRTGLAVAIIEGVLVDEAEDVSAFLVRSHHELTVRAKAPQSCSSSSPVGFERFKCPTKVLPCCCVTTSVASHRAALPPWQSDPAVRSMSRRAMAHPRSVPALRREYRTSMHRVGPSSGSLRVVNAINPPRHSHAGLYTVVLAARV